MISLWRTSGPAMSWGKKLTKRQKSRTVLMPVAAAEVDQVGDLLEDEEADAERQHDAQRASRARRRAQAG